MKSLFLLKKHFFKFAVALLVCACCFFPLSSQSQNNFPEGSSSGTTEMSRRITGLDFPNLSFSATAPRSGNEVAFSVQLLLLLTLLTLAPSIFILMTCFLRFSIVLDFIKRALSLQQVPPTAVLNGIAIFMTLFCMWPTFRQIYTDSFQPLSNNEITLTEAIEKAESPIRIFMFRQMGNDKNSIRTFMTMAGLGRPANASDVPTYVLIPAYILHELTVAFKIGDRKSVV